MKVKIYVLAALTILAAALVFTEIVYSKEGKINPVSEVAITVFSPFQRLLLKTTRFFHHISSLNSQESQNKQLENQIAALQEQIYNLKIKKYEVLQLNKELEFSKSLRIHAVQAQVVSRNPSSWFSNFTLNKGTDNRITAGDGVVGAGTAVGKIMQTSSRFSNVAFITNSHVAFPIEVLPGNYNGICYGNGRKKCIVRYLPLDAKIKPGAEVVTVNIGHIFPINGIPVGTISKIEADPREAFFKKGIVLPYFEEKNFFSVQVITKQPSAKTIKPSVSSAK
jgi:rod shape-determining protein MreC